VDALASESFCYLTTTGRRTGRPHTIEIWFGLRDATVYMLSGGGDRSDWVKNLRSTASVDVRIGSRSFRGYARVVDRGVEDAVARRLLASKYQGWREGAPMSTWARTAVPVAVDLEVPS
jgi:deazaflavin-dependent oxidoreductase (nitroreductase family)